MGKHKWQVISLSLLASLILLAAVMLLILATDFSLPRIYSGEAIHGRVVDSRTKLPIRKVVVVEVWELEGGLHTDHTANIHIAETVTDDNGYYSFPEWGPKFTTEGTMSEFSPVLVFFKFGYDDTRLANSVSGNLNLDSRASEHSGKIIELEKFDGNAEEYQKTLDSVYSVLELSHYRGSFDCMWTKVPRFTAEMIQTGNYFRRHKIGTGFPSLESLPESNCSNPEETLKGYLQ